jgi:dephospho-CoA kinase
MKTENTPLIVALVGMPGAGKSSCVDYLTNKGFPSVYFGGITLKEVKKRGLEINPENEKKVREELRELHGIDAYAKLIADEIEQLTESGENYIIADGVYSWSEYKYFKNLYGENAIIIAIAADRQLRHSRLASRPERPLTEQQVTDREYAEIENIEKGGPIANADYTIVNNENTSELFSQLDEILHSRKFGPQYQ